MGAGPGGSDITGSGNLYSGFTGQSVFDLTAGVRTAGVPGGAGFTTILVQVAGSSGGPGGGAAPSGFTASSFKLNNVAPDYITSGYAANATELFYLEWDLPGNAALYTLDLDTEVSSSSLSKITIDTKWDAAQSLQNARVTVVPEPSTTVALLALAGLGLATAGRWPPRQSMP